MQTITTHLLALGGLISLPALAGPADATPVRQVWMPADLQVGFVLHPDALVGDRQTFVDLVGQTERDVWIVDASFDRARPSRWTWGEVERMRGGADRKVLAWLSVGVAETGREYWDDAWMAPGAAPSYVIGPREGEPHEHRVRWWEPAWQAQVYEMIDGVLARGFDGVVLAGVDAWMDFEGSGDLYQPDAINPETGHSWRQDMATWVADVSAYARRGAHGPFVVLAQDGVDLLAQPGYGDVIDGLVVEDMFRFGESREAWLDRYLRPFAAAGGAVLVVEDPQDAMARARAEQEAAVRGCALLFRGDEGANLGLTR